MSLFPRTFVSPDPTTSFSPLFRLLDEFDTYNRSSGNNHDRHHHRSHLAKSFNPKFDVKELADKYELHGELPGIEQKDIEIEFTDPQTLSISGRSNHSYQTSGNLPTGRIEGAQNGQITEKGEPQSGHNATVEEDTNEAHQESTVATSQQPQESQAKWWVSERTTGEFHRSFSFPTSVDVDAVTASMKNGIISIVVPKAKKAAARKITLS